MAEKKVYKFPKSLALCADKFFELNKKRLEMQKLVDAVDEEAKAIKAHLIDNLPKSDASGVAGKLCRVTVVSKDIPQIKDREAFNKFILKTKDFSLLQGRLSDAAVRDRWENGKEVPGVEHFTAVTLSVNKL